jgi:hypothetical protein
MKPKLGIAVITNDCVRVTMEDEHGAVEYYVDNSTGESVVYRTERWGSEWKPSLGQTYRAIWEPYDQATDEATKGQQECSTP